MTGLRKVLAGLAAISAMVGAGPAYAQFDEDAARAAFDLCLDLPEDIGIARDRLVEAGWQAEEGAAYIALFNSYFAFGFNSLEPEYTFQNAAFMAISVLGNSALGPDQIGMQTGNMSLAVLGIPEQSGYCVITGDDDLLRVFSDYPDIAGLTRLSSEYLAQAAAIYPDGIVGLIARTNRDAVMRVLGDANLSDRDVELADSQIAAATSQIVPLEILQ